MANTIESNRNVIIINGTPTSSDAPFFSTAVYNLTAKKGFGEIVIDFSRSENLFEKFMVPAICTIMALQEKQVDVELILPEADYLRNLFRNANWAYLIAPRYHEQSTFYSDKHLPAYMFNNSQSQTEAVDRTMNIIMSSFNNLERKSLAALEWAVNEITDNVLNHSMSLGGIIQATTFKESNCVEFVVADSGIGIRKSLDEASDAIALEKAIQEGVTRNRQTNAGNGLFGSYEITSKSRGSFEIISGKAMLKSTATGTKILPNKCIYNGTVVVSRINCSDPNVLSNALKFRGKKHSPSYDYIEKHYESENAEEFYFRMKNESNSFGNREVGRSIYNKLANILNSEEKHIIKIDFSDLYVISSSFADEVFGRLFVDLGPIEFMRRILFTNIDENIKGLIDRAIMQRTASFFVKGSEV